jgi:phytoene desaturase
MARKPIVIIGAGIGGLSTAVHLASAGQKVLVYEKNTAVGGKMSQIHTPDGYRFDTGPSVITMRHVFTDLFATAGRNLDDYLTFLPVDPLTRYFFPDEPRTTLDMRRDLSATLAQIEAIEPRDVEGYLNYLAYAARIHRLTGPVFIYDQPPTPASFLRVPVQDWLKVDPFRTMHGAIRRFVRSPHLQQLLGRFATYVGASPYLAPATLNVIAHVELSGGVWYPQGGVYQIAAALAQLAQELGVEIVTGQGVEQIELTEGDNRATAVVLTTGQRIEAAAVVSNLDVTTTYEKLLPPHPARDKRLRQLKSQDPSCSGFILLWGIDKTHPDLAHHNILFGGDYAAEFREIFQHGRVPHDPTIYLAITSKTDPDHAPPGHENWFVLVNAPPTQPDWDWATHAPTYRDHLLDKLAAWGFPLRPHIRYEKIITPADLAQHNGAHRGALYGASSNDMLAAFRRPHNRVRQFPGLYLVGGTTHPGGGVPMVTLSGKVAATMLLADLAHG